MTYIPKVNDYVLWNEFVEGWIYFKGPKYLTIETNVRPKTVENLKACSLHRNERLLVLCYAQQWNELTYKGYRSNKYSSEILSERVEE